MTVKRDGEIIVIANFQLPIANCHDRYTPFGNRQLPIGNQCMHPSATADGTDFMTLGRFKPNSEFLCGRYERVVAAFIRKAAGESDHAHRRRFGRGAQRQADNMKV